MKLKLFFLACCLLRWLFASAQVDTTQQIVDGRENSPAQQTKPYVILISADGFRYDYAEKYQATHLLRFANEGVKADALIPSYPSLTFPNHYSIVTGLYPSHHGIVGNYFYAPGRKAFYSSKDPKAVRDGSWYSGTPLWVLAEEQHMLTASFFWVGSEADIKGVLPTYYYHFNDSLPLSRRINQVVAWLRLPPWKRPHLITFYISQTDHAGHIYGPAAPETAAAVKSVDSAVEKLVRAVNTTGLPVNFIFLSDHGMTKVDVDHPLSLPGDIDTSHFVIPAGAELIQLYARNKMDVGAAYLKLKKEENGFKAYRRDFFPYRLHFDRWNDSASHIGDILLVPDWPLFFNLSKRKPDAGAHGYDPYEVKDMLATFYAWGPAFKHHLTIPAFENVNVYPIVTTILGLGYSERIDGTPEVARRILK